MVGSQRTTVCGTEIAYNGGGIAGDNGLRSGATDSKTILSHPSPYHHALRPTGFFGPDPEIQNFFRPHRGIRNRTFSKLCILLFVLLRASLVLPCYLPCSVLRLCSVLPRTDAGYGPTRSLRLWSHGLSRTDAGYAPTQGDGSIEEALMAGTAPSYQY
eukprot:3859554-Rhodomonas_salina.1